VQKENFEAVFKAVAERKQMPRSTLVLEHEGNKVFPSMTPEMLRIFFATELRECQHCVCLSS
jgi:hypothetical protein